MAFIADRELHDQPPSRAGPSAHALATAPATELRSYLSLLWRRKWIVLPFLVLTPLAAHFATGERAATYEASAQVLLNRQSANVSGLGDPLVFDATRTIRTQARIARLPAIARRVVAEAKLDWTAGALLAQSAVDSDPDVDLLTFRVQDAEPARTMRLANLYANNYIEYRRQLDTTALSEALRILRLQIAALRRQGLESTGGFSTLLDRQQQLQTAFTLQKSNAILVQRATDVSALGGANRQSDLLALAAGIIIALALAFLVDAFDTRIRSAEELANELGLPLLGNLRKPQSLGRRQRLVMLEAPDSAGAEMFRILRSTLEVTPALDEGRIVMITSAFAGEGKSTTAANLAVAMTRARRRVILIDLDLRRPKLDELFDLPAGSGVTDVLLGNVGLDEALTRVPLSPRDRKRSNEVVEGTRRASGRDGDGGRHDGLGGRDGDGGRHAGLGVGGTLDVVRAGGRVPYTSDFLLTPSLDEFFEQLRLRADLIVVDGPPLLPSADALTLSSRVDALLLVARAKTLRREQLGQLKRALAMSPAVTLGLVVLGNVGSEIGYYQSPPAPESSRQLFR